MKPSGNRRGKEPLAAVAIILAGWTIPVRGNVLLNTDAHAAVSPLPIGNYQSCHQDAFGFGFLTTATCNPIVDIGSEPGNPPIPYVTTFSANAASYAAYGGKLGVHDSASVTSSIDDAFLGVGATANTLVEDKVHALSMLLPVGALMDLQVNVLV